MDSTEYQQYLATPHWKARRKEHIERWPWCRKCYMPRWLAKVAYDQDLHAHHKTYANLGNEGPYDLQSLCRRCHDVETFGRSDLREVKGHKCTSCQVSVTFDPYSDECEVCQAWRQERCPPCSETVDLPREGMNGGHRWQPVIFSIAEYVGIDRVMDFLADTENQIRSATEWLNRDKSKDAERTQAVLQGSNDRTAA